MPYEIKLPPLRSRMADLLGGSPMSKNPVTPVTGGNTAYPAHSEEIIARLVGMPLNEFVREGCPLEVRVPWFAGTLWFVPTEADAWALVHEGISRGRVWTAGELMDLLAITGLTSNKVKTIAEAKLEFGGEVVEVRRRADVQPEGEA